MILWIFGYGDFRNLIIFLSSNFSPFFEKIKNYFLIQNSENLSTYSYYECLLLKNAKSAINAQETQQKTFKFFRSPKKLRLWGGFWVRQQVKKKWYFQKLVWYLHCTKRRFLHLKADAKYIWGAHFPLPPTT